MSAVAESFLKRSVNAAEETFNSLLDLKQHVNREATPEQARTYLELVKHFAEGLDGLRVFVRSMEGK